MNFGFDLDDTITEEPDAFRSIMEALVSAGHGVYVITGVMPNITSPELTTEEGREKQLIELGLFRSRHYTDIRLAIAKGARGIANRKRDICLELGIALMFEDRSDYANAMRDVTRCVLMWPR